MPIRSFFTVVWLTLVFSSFSSAAPLTYSSFIEWNFPHLPKLTAWRETERLMATALSEAYPSLQIGPRLENGSATQLKSFSQGMGMKPIIQVVYLAAHQSPAGQWVLTDGTILPPDQLLPPIMNSAGAVIFLDCCYARSALPGKAGRVIFASNPDEPTPDLFPYRRSPIDWRRFCPHAITWLHQHHFGGSDERLSFMGLVWLEAFVTAPQPPAVMADWEALGGRMQSISQAVLKEEDRREASSISLNL